MDKHVAERWVEALRSGQYQQGQDYLHPTRESFCCLGVLCDLYRVEQGKGEWAMEAFFPGPDNEHREDGVLPAPVMEWAGMQTSDGGYSGEMSLAAANDEGAAFPELAALIEKKWEVL